MVYLISYDLVGKNEDYQPLVDALRRDGGLKILRSQWLVHSNFPALAVAERYNAHLDRNDRIFVCEVTTNSAYRNVLNEHDAAVGFFPALRQAA